MSTKTTAELQAMRKLARQLLNKLDALIGDSVEVEEPAWVAEKLAKRECLGCGIIVPIGDEYYRGLHGACYHTTLRRFREGEWSESERVAMGKIAKDLRKPGKEAAIDKAPQRSIAEGASAAVEKNVKRLGGTKSTRKKAAD
jgi:hypothetical protein